MFAKIVTRIHRATTTADYDEMLSISNYTRIPRSCRPHGLALNDEAKLARQQHQEADVLQKFAKSLQRFLAKVNDNETIACQCCQKLTRQIDIKVVSGDFLRRNGVFPEMVDGDRYSACRDCTRVMRERDPSKGKIPDGHLVNGCSLPAIPDELKSKSKSLCFFL